MIDARFGHVNVIARDWRSLADFYTRVFGCDVRAARARHRGPVLEAGTGVPGAALRGAHLRLPGLGDDRPDARDLPVRDDARGRRRRRSTGPASGTSRSRCPIVPTAREAVLAAGGGAVGEVVTTETADGRRVTWTYVTDPEGNILELQSWSDTARESQDDDAARRRGPGPAGAPPGSRAFAREMPRRPPAQPRALGGSRACRRRGGCR